MQLEHAVRLVTTRTKKKVHSPQYQLQNRTARDLAKFLGIPILLIS